MLKVTRRKTTSALLAVRVTKKQKVSNLANPTLRQKSGRVRERRCRHSLPLEPDVRLSPHPAQADTKPRRNGAGFTTVIAPCHLYDTRLQPPDLAFTLGPVHLIPVRRFARGRTHG
jgi:hypothetical protein